MALEALKDAGVKGPIGFEAEGLSAEGFFTLRTRTSSPVVPTRGIVERLRIVKDAAELDLIRKATALADYGMGVEVAASWPGNTEANIMAEGNAAMLREGLKRHFDHRIEAQSRPVSGPKTVLPHSLPSARQLSAGDVVIHSTACTVNGYHAEDERTVFIESPSDAQRPLFEIMERAAAAALRAIRPGVACREVDRVAREVIEQAGYGPQFIHRTGHGLGLDDHELPFFAPGDDTELLPGMVMSVGPGIYVEGIGGFRHSDTVVVTGDGCESLTSYPRDLEALVVRV
jgi:Xaa-Pro dipeptidase